MSHIDGKDSVSFQVVDGVNRKLKVLGIRNEETLVFDTVPAPFIKDEIVELVEGPYPLTDFRDTSYHRAHTYIVAKSNGTRIGGILHTFTIDCTLHYQDNKLGNPRLEILFPKTTTAPSSMPTNSSVNPPSLA